MSLGDSTGPLAYPVKTASFLELGALFGARKEPAEAANLIARRRMLALDTRGHNVGAAKTVVGIR